VNTNRYLNSRSVISRQSTVNPGRPDSVPRRPLEKLRDPETELSGNPQRGLGHAEPPGDDVGLAVPAVDVADRAVRLAPGTHAHKHFGKVCRGNALGDKQPDHEIKVGVKPVAGIESPHLDQEAAAHEQGGMGRMPPRLEHAGHVRFRFPVAQDLPGVGLAYVDEVAMDRVPCASRHGVFYPGKHVRARVNVIRIEEADVIARGGGNALVHGIVKPPVRFGNEMGNASPESFDNRGSAVRRSPVYDQVFEVCLFLRRYRSERTFYGRSAVE